jgi:polyisoprenoid-binding protein YceI
MKRWFGAGLLVLATSISGRAANETWKIVAADNLNVAVAESITTVENFTARTNKVSGTITFDREAKTGSGTITIDGRSFTTGVPLRDEHMASKDWLNFAQNPDIRFATTRVKYVGGDNYNVTGAFTLNGITKVIATSASVRLTEANEVTRNMNVSGDVIAFTTTFKIKLSEYGVKHPLVQAGRVNDDLKITLRAIASNQ